MRPLSQKPLHTAELPRPISVNNLNGNAAKGRRSTKAYEAWKAQAQAMLMAQGKRPAILEPVRISICIGTHGVSPAFDTDNAAKAYLDLLVDMGVLPDDNRTVVKELTLSWQAGDGASVRIWRA